MSVLGTETERLSPDELTTVKEITAFLSTTLRALQIYVPTNPLLQDFRSHLFDKFREFLCHHERLSLMICEFELLYKGEEVYESKEKGKSIAFMLYRDGLRELSFLKDLDPSELLAFMEILQVASESSEEDSDIVSALWQEDLSNIRWVAIEELVDGGERDLAEIPRQEERTETVGSPGAGTSEVGAFTAGLSSAGTSVTETSKLGGSMPAPELATLETSMDLLLLNGDEIEQLHGMVDQASELDAGRVLVETLFDLLSLEEELTPWKQILELIGSCLAHLITNGEFLLALTVIRRLRMMADNGVVGSAEEEAAMSRILNRAGSDEILKQLRKRLLDETADGEKEPILACLSLLNGNAMPAVCEMFLEAKATKLGRQLKQVITSLGERDPTAFESMLFSHSPELVSEMIPLLVEIQGEAAMGLLEECAVRKEEEVRLQVARSLKRIGGERARELILTFLDDEAPEVRRAAFKRTGELSGDSVASRVVPLVERSDYSGRSLGERRGLLDLLGRSGSEEAISTLSRILRRESLFSRRENDKVRIYAAHALGSIGTKKAIDALREGGRSRRRLVRRTCEKLLTRLEGSEET